MPISRNRKKKKNAKKKKETAMIKKGIGIAPSPIKMKYMEGTWDQSLGTTFEERLEALRKVGQEATENFPVKYQAIPNWFKKYDQLKFLSFSAYYFLTTTEGYDEEALTGTLEFPMHYQELLQAFALTIPRTYDPRPFSEEVEQFKRDFREIGDLIKSKHFHYPDTIKEPEDVYAHTLRTEMMLHTTAVRNWSYEHKMKKVTLDLAAGVSQVFESCHGFNPKVLLETLYKMTDDVQQRLNEHRSNTVAFLQETDYRKVMDAYESRFPVLQTTPEQRKRLWKGAGKNLQSLKAMYLMHSDLFLEEAFSFDLRRVQALSVPQISAEKIGYIFDRLSMNFGDLAAQNAEHFLLSNPVHERPFIYVNENTVFSSLWSVMTHLSIGLLEKLCGENEDLKNKYNSVRAVYLENEVASLFTTSFPMARVLKGSKWTGKDGKEYENDLIVIIDSFAIIIECKAGMVSPPAKRGAQERLFKTLQGLIEEPSQQAFRFIEFLKAHPVALSLKTKKGPNNTFDASKLKYYIPLGITLSHLGIAGTNLKHLIKAGVTEKKVEELAISVSLTDIQIIFEMLPLAAEKIHYLQRRREIEATIEYKGDELDLFAVYLENGFNFSQEWENYQFFNLILKSKELDHYIISAANQEYAIKPALRKTTWWKDILQRLEEKQFQTWLESSYILLNVSFDAQQRFENLVENLKKALLKGDAKYPHNWVVLFNAEENRRFAITGYCYFDRLKKERNDIIGDILYDDATKEVKGKLVIGLNADNPHYPYSVLGCWLSSELFDNNFMHMLRANKNPTI